MLSYFVSFAQVYRLLFLFCNNSFSNRIIAGLLPLCKNILQMFEFQF